MEMRDEKRIAADVSTVWAALLDADVLKASVPGCESLTGSPDEGFTAVVKQKVGPVSAKFTGVVMLSDLIPEQSLTLSGEGKGGPAGFAKGGAQVTLTLDGEGTILAYSVQANVGGKLAQLGSRIIDGFAKKLADEFFTRFQEAVEGPSVEAEEMTGDETGEKGWFKRLIG